MIAKWLSNCSACHQPIPPGTPIKRHLLRVGGWGTDGRWEDTGKFRHVACPKVVLPRRHAPRVSGAQIWDGDV